MLIMHEAYERENRMKDCILSTIVIAQKAPKDRSHQKTFLDHYNIISKVSLEEERVAINPVCPSGFSSMPGPLHQNSCSQGVVYPGPQNEHSDRCDILLQQSSLADRSCHFDRPRVAGCHRHRETKDHRKCGLHW